MASSLASPERTSSCAKLLLISDTPTSATTKLLIMPTLGNSMVTCTELYGRKSLSSICRVQPVLGKIRGYCAIWLTETLSCCARGLRILTISIRRSRKIGFTFTLGDFTGSEVTPTSSEPSSTRCRILRLKLRYTLICTWGKRREYSANTSGSTYRHVA